MARIEGARAFPLLLLLSTSSMASLLFPDIGRADVAAGAASFEGTFRHLGGSSDRKALEQAIDEATADMSFFVRKIARARLRSRLSIPSWQTFRFEGSDLTIGSPNGSVTAPTSGAVTKTTNQNGDAIEVSHHLRGTTIRQVVTTEEGRRETTFALDPETGRLRVEVTISSDALPNPIRYRLTYGR